MDCALLSIKNFFHPDCTVGYGIAPYHALCSLARIFIHTAGGELRPAPKYSNCFMVSYVLFFFNREIVCPMG